MEKLTTLSWRIPENVNFFIDMYVASNSFLLSLFFIVYDFCFVKVYLMIFIYHVVG